MEDQFAAGGGGVDRLLEAAEPDPMLSKASDGVDQVAPGAAEAVEFPDDQGVAGAQQVEELLEDGPVGRRPRRRRRRSWSAIPVSRALLRGEA
jgi:hypothetical protein